MLGQRSSRNAAHPRAGGLQARRRRCATGRWSRASAIARNAWDRRAQPNSASCAHYSRAEEVVNRGASNPARRHVPTAIPGYALSTSGVPGPPRPVQGRRDTRRSPPGPARSTTALSNRAAASWSSSTIRPFRDPVSLSSPSGCPTCRVEPEPRAISVLLFRNTDYVMYFPFRSGRDRADHRVARATYGQAARAA